MYRQLFIVTTVINEPYLRVTTPMFKLVLSFCVISSVYAYIRLGNSLDLFTTIFLLSACTTGLFELMGATKMASELHELSSMFEANWRPITITFPGSGHRRRYFQMKLKACRPFSCPCWNFYKIKKNTKITFTALVFDVTMHLLLAL
jgi:hypothetical protein